MHSPRPWTHDEGEPHMLMGDPDAWFDCYYIFEANGSCVAIVPDDPYLGDAVLDNVHLMKAAPDLLKECEALLSIICNLPTIPSWEPKLTIACRRARMTVDKARGHDQ